MLGYRGIHNGVGQRNDVPGWLELPIELIYGGRIIINLDRPKALTTK